MKSFSNTTETEENKTQLNQASPEAQFCEVLQQITKRTKFLDQNDAHLKRSCLLVIENELLKLIDLFQLLREEQEVLKNSVTPELKDGQTPSEPLSQEAPADTPTIKGRFRKLKIPPVAKIEEALKHTPPATRKVTLAPGSHGEHELQNQLGTKVRALNFYNKQVLGFLAPKMREFIATQEFLFVATADSDGECDCTSKFGQPGFIHVLNEKYLLFPEYRGNGVMANFGNITENPHIALLIMDFQKEAIGLHINGKARIVENEELLQHANNLPPKLLAELRTEGSKRPERWTMVEVEEAYVQCSKHIPLMQKMPKTIDWGTDSDAAKRVDFFQLQDIPLFDRVGGNKAMEVVVDAFYRKVLADEFVAPFFADVDMDGQRQKQKAFLSMAFGGPYQYSGLDLRKAHKRFVNEMGLNDQHFDRILELIKDTLTELDVPEKPIHEMLDILETTRADVLCR